jgi:hypothetical protein
VRPSGLYGSPLAVGDPSSSEPYQLLTNGSASASLACATATAAIVPDTSMALKLVFMALRILDNDDLLNAAAQRLTQDQIVSSNHKKLLEAY